MLYNILLEALNGVFVGNHVGSLDRVVGELDCNFYDGGIKRHTGSGGEGSRYNTTRARGIGERHPNGLATRKPVYIDIFRRVSKDVGEFNLYGGLGEALGKLEKCPRDVVGVSNLDR